jgi:DNA-binding transcriptional regulator YhcF (GntR family)
MVSGVMRHNLFHHIWRGEPKGTVEDKEIALTDDKLLKSKRLAKKRLAKLFSKESEESEAYDDDTFGMEEEAPPQLPRKYWRKLEDVPLDPGRPNHYSERGITPENSARTRLLYRLHHYYDSGDPQEKAVLLAIAASHNRHTGCWPSLRTLAILTGGLSPRTIQRKLGILEDRGFLKRYFRQGRSTIYALQQTKLLRLMEEEKKARKAMKQGMYIITHQGLEDDIKS